MKNFVLDTNILLHNPQALFSFGKNRVIIPISVIEEIDTFKRGLDEKSRHARIFSRSLDALRSKGKISEGVPLENGGIVSVALRCDQTLPPGMDFSVKDNRILLFALQAQKDFGSTIFVSKDLNARIKADALGIQSEDFETNKVDIDELYKGWREVEVPRGVLDKLAKGGIEPQDLPEGEAPVMNEFFVLRSGDLDPVHGKFDGEAGRIIPLEHDDREPWGIRALNAQQMFCLEALLDRRIELVTLVGQAGTGKTLLALAAGLQSTVDDRHFRRMLVARPIVPMGRDIGYLPGTKDEKLQTWMQPIFDNLEFIFDRYLDGEVKAEDQLQFLMEAKKIELEAITYIRGRSVPAQWVIIDETQNLTPHEVKTIISRAGEGTKVILTGDPYQIDHPYLDAQSNGLAYVVERFKGVPVFAHVTLEVSERSHLAGLAANLL